MRGRGHPGSRYTSRTCPVPPARAAAPPAAPAASSARRAPWGGRGSASVRKPRQNVSRPSSSFKKGRPCAQCRGTVILQACSAAGRQQVAEPDRPSGSVVLGARVRPLAAQNPPSSRERQRSFRIDVPPNPKLSIPLCMAGYLPAAAYQNVQSRCLRPSPAGVVAVELLDGSNVLHLRGGVLVRGLRCKVAGRQGWSFWRRVGRRGHCVCCMQ